MSAQYSTSPAGGGKKKRKKKRKHRMRNHFLRFFIFVFVFISLYLTACYSQIPFIKKWRTLYIETAMTTMSHHWLAELFIPKSIVDQVVADINADIASQEELSSTWETESAEGEGSVLQGELTPEEIYQSEAEMLAAQEAEFYQKYWELDTLSFRNYLADNPDLMLEGYDNILIEDFDKKLGIEDANGNRVLVVDTANNLLILGLSSKSYVGKLCIIKESSQVDLVKSDTLGKHGEIIQDIGDRYGAILAVNASGFVDKGGHGKGGEVVGSLLIDGVEYGDPTEKWKLLGLKNDNRLYATNYESSDITDYRWGIQFRPALIINGEAAISGSFGMGIQPRTAVGQTRDGDFLILAIDGRQVGYSLGCSVETCKDLLLTYNAYQAINCDGGSSTVLYYRGKLISKPCSVSKRGRYLPDAIIVNPAGTDTQRVR